MATVIPAAASPISRKPTSLPLAATVLAGHAVNALIAEAFLTPKPALVDQRGSGAHRDMNLPCLVRSANALEQTFLEIAIAATGQAPSPALREELACIGRRGEAAMFEATGGINAHRGAIWVIGLLVAARAMVGGGAQVSLVAATAGEIATFIDRFAPRSETHGTRVCARYGVPGARGEASRGFPHIVHRGLPALKAARARGLDERHARLDCLLAIMSSLEDTCLLHRGGQPALWAARYGARRVLRSGGTSTAEGLAALLMLDEQLLALNASPGGCADLLAGCLFLAPAAIYGES